MLTNRIGFHAGLWCAASLMAVNMAAAQSPLSAIDWLSESIQKPMVVVPRDSHDISTNASPEDITITRLDQPTLDAVGLLPNSVTGLPRDLWGTSTAHDISTRIAAIDSSSSPAVQDLIYTLLLAELEPPIVNPAPGMLFLTRIDYLLGLGALDQVQAMLDVAGPNSPDLFRRWFDVGLLTGTENIACDALRTNSDIAPTFPTRIFCLARNGDWNAAALTLETAHALGFLTEDEDALLARFLDPELFEGEAPLTPPARPTPLVFRMFEAIGEPLATAQLPSAFAHSDLRHVVGWKAQIEAAERLARSGAIDTNLLLGLYLERLPAASGGIWDRVEAFQRFDLAMRANNPNAVSKALPDVWTQMTDAGLQVPFARIYGADLANVTLTGPAASLAFRIGLLSDSYENVANSYTPQTEAEAFLASLAKGTPMMAFDAKTATIQDGFSARALPEDLQRTLAQNRMGEAILIAANLFSSGMAGDLEDAATALTLFRQIGLEDTARRAALQMLLLKSEI